MPNGIKNSDDRIAGFGFKQADIGFIKTSFYFFSPRFSRAIFKSLGLMLEPITV